MATKYTKFFERIVQYWVAIQPQHNPNNKAVIIRCYGNKSLSKIEGAFNNLFNVTTFSGESFGDAEMNDVKLFSKDYKIIDTITFRSQNIEEVVSQVTALLK